MFCALLKTRIGETPVAEPKQVILIRTDLKMPKGKAVAQGAHASLQALLGQGTRDGLTWTIKLRPDQIPWLEGSYAKVCLRVSSEEQLRELRKQALEAGLPTALILDEGRTVFKEPTVTCGAIGPADGDLVNEITQGLKLF